MVETLDFPEELQHPGWTGQRPDIIRADGLQLSNLDVGTSTVKLHFHFGSGSATGSGFIVDMPDSEKAVILTAGHNLIGGDGNRSTKLTVMGIDGETETKGYVVPEEDIHVSEAYLVQQTEEDDWGIILYPREWLSDPKETGFGYSLRLGHAENIRGTVYVSGYQDTTPVASPVTSSGVLVDAGEKRLEYRCKTEQGISGSAVWIEYGGQPTAVAIHNHGAKRKGGSSRGTRLTAAVLHEISTFAKVGHYGVTLRAYGTPSQRKQLPPSGLFLTFPNDFAFARVRRGSGTPVDVVPAEASKGVVMYAICVEGQWALFNVARKEVVLTKSVREDCFFKNISKGTEKKKPGSVIMTIVLERDQGRYQLRMQGKRIRDFDDDEDAESSEVSMVAYPNKDTFVQFELVPCAVKGDTNHA